MDTKADRRCRICLCKEGPMISIFTKEDRKMISTKIMRLAKVRIHPSDGLPSLICSICCTKLNNCIAFIQLCEVSDSRLKTSISIANDDYTGNENSSDTENKCYLKVENFEESEVDKVDCNVKNVIKDLFSHKNAKYNDKTQEKKKLTKEIKITQQCNICGRVMSSRHRLKTHLVTHTGERPFSCPYCNKTFSLDANRKVHMRVHTGEKPFPCPICGETFAQSSGLIAHKRKHTGQLPYKCMLCPRSFRTIGHLQYHTKRHTGEKKFDCDKCGRAFITRGDLNQHLTTHSGDRAHVCSVCGLRLTRASNLKRHVQQLHSAKNLASVEGKREERTDTSLTLNKLPLD